MTTQAPTGQKYCSTCGTLIHERAEICPSCGVRQLGVISNVGGQAAKSRTTAALLAILLGGIGAHKFYLGQTGMGLIYLVCSCTFIPLLVGLIEGLTYLGMTDETFFAKYS